jgi:acetyltransferase-like isoleucine patch superfamily enzyme
MRYSEHLSNISPQATIPDSCTIHAGVHIHDKVVMGERCSIQAGAMLFNGVTLEDDVFIGPAVIFTNDRKIAIDVGGRDKFYPVPTLVKKGARIGANATILCGITIGEGAKIGAGSVVTKDVPAGETWVGNPARPMIK